MPGVVLGGRPHGQPVRAAVGADAGQVEGLRALPASGAGWCSSSTSEGPYLRASSAQICPADSVTEAAEPVWVTTAGWPGSRPAVSHIRR